MEIEVLQYYRPGKLETSLYASWKLTKIHVALNLETEYASMQESDCRLEAEVLTTNEVSLTVFDQEREEDIDIEIVERGPAVRKALETLLTRQRWLALAKKPTVDLS
jgi:hypothetical protein